MFEQQAEAQHQSHVAELRALLSTEGT